MTVTLRLPRLHTASRPTADERRAARDRETLFWINQADYLDDRDHPTGHR